MSQQQNEYQHRVQDSIHLHSIVAHNYVLPVEPVQPVDLVHLGRYFMQLTLFSFLLLLDCLYMRLEQSADLFVFLPKLGMADQLIASHSLK